MQTCLPPLLARDRGHHGGCGVWCSAVLRGGLRTRRGNSANPRPTSHSKVLMLGAGFVTKPTLDILSESGVQVTVGTRILIHVPLVSPAQPHLVTWTIPPPTAPSQARARLASLSTSAPEANPDAPRQPAGPSRPPSSSPLASRAPSRPPSMSTTHRPLTPPSPNTTSLSP